MVWRVIICHIGLICLLAGDLSAGVSSNLPHVRRKMEKAEFWIGRLQEADKVLLASEEIDLLNRKNLSLEPSAVDVALLAETLPGAELRRRIKEDLTPFQRKSFYTWDPSGENILFGRMEFELLKERMRLGEIPERVEVRFGLVVRDCDLRSLPTQEGVFEERGDRDFDLLQQTRLSVATPVAVLWENDGGRWLYLGSSLLQGWVERDAIGFFKDQAELAAYLKKPFLVVTVPRLENVWKAPDSSDLARAFTMGTVLHGYRERDAFYEVECPTRGEDGGIVFLPLRMSKSDGIHPGFLPLTRANILRQALQLKGVSYGWGGLRGGYDCSSFLHDVFLTMGVVLPRNSEPQSKAGKILAVFSRETKEKTKRATLSSASPATTLVKLDGHIMLYVGEVKKRHYVIHATSGYRSWRFFQDRGHRVMAVVISDLSLGEGSRRGSLLDRIVSINTLTE